MDETSFKVLVTGAKPLTGKNGKDELVFSWNSDSPIYAINFATGFVEALSYSGNCDPARPLLQQLDGYWWRFERGKYHGMMVKVVDADGKIDDNKTMGFN